MNKNILITGGLGFIGRNLYTLLVKKKFNVFILDKKKNSVKKFLPNLKKKFIPGDFQNKKLLNKIIKINNINIIFHMAATTQVLEALKAPEHAYINNIFGTVKLLEVLRNIRKKIIFIYSSTDKAYGETGLKSLDETTQMKAIFPYDLSKTCSDLICQSYSKTYNLKIGILRCVNTYGPGDLNLKRIIPETIISVLKNKNINIRSNGNFIRNYLYVKDAVNAYYLLMKKLINNKKNLRIYNVGSKNSLSVIQLVKMILDKFKIDYKKIKMKNYSKREIRYQKLNYSKIIKELNWRETTSLDSGLNETIDWYKKNLKLL